MAKKFTAEAAIANAEYTGQCLLDHAFNDLSDLEHQGVDSNLLDLDVTSNRGRPFPKMPFGLQKASLPINGEPVMPRDGLSLVMTITPCGWYACPSPKPSKNELDPLVVDDKAIATETASSLGSERSPSISLFNDDEMCDLETGFQYDRISDASLSERYAPSINDKEELPVEKHYREMWNLIRSDHAMRDKTRKSQQYLQEDDDEANRLLAPMYKAAGKGFALKPHQRDGIGMMLDFEKSIYRGCLLGDEMGLGKTVQLLALYLLNPITEPMLVVVPAAIISNWVSEIKMFLGLPDRDVFVYKGDTVTSTTLKKKRIVITSFTRLYMEQQVLEETLMDFKLLRVDPGASHRPDPKSTRKKPRPEILSMLAVLFYHYLEPAGDESS